MHQGHQSQTPDLATPAISQYAQAMKHIARGQHSIALQKLEANSRQLPETLAIAQSLNSIQHFQKTINLLTPLAKVRPGEQSILVPLSNALLGAGRINEAWDHLKHVIPTEQTSLAFFEVKQEVARRKGYIADAYLTAAERNTRIGEFKHAMAQLRQAIKLPGMTGQDTARLQSKLTAIQQQSEQ